MAYNATFTDVSLEKTTLSSTLNISCDRPSFEKPNTTAATLNTELTTSNIKTSVKSSVLEYEEDQQNTDTSSQEKTLSNITEYLGIELIDENSQQKLNDDSTYQQIEEQLMYGDMDPDSRIDMVYTYLNTFEEKASNNFIMNILEVSAYALDTDAQAEMIHTVGYYLRHKRAYHDDNYRDTIVQSLQNYAHDTNDTVRKAAFIALSRSMENQAEKETFLAMYRNDKSPEIRAMALLMETDNIVL